MSIPCKKPIPVLGLRALFRNPNLRIKVHRETRQPAVPEHRHDFFEIVLVHSGTAVHVTGKLRHSIGAGDVLVLNDRRSHSYECNHNLSLFNILIRKGVITQIGRAVSNLPGYKALFTRETPKWRRLPYQSWLHLSPQDLRQCEEWAERINAECWADARNKTALSEAYLTLLVALLARRFGMPEHASRPVSGLGSVCAQLEKMDQSSPMLGVAKEAGMSYRTLQRVFRKTFGLTPSAYRIQMRLSRAASLLRQDGKGLRISEIASQCGFDDSNYFSRCFRQATGQSPRAYRKTYLKGMK